MRRNPLSAILAVAVQHGVKALVGALGGSDLVSSAGAGITAALIAGESRIPGRLDAIERQLEDVLDRRFTVELATGSRFDPCPAPRQVPMKACADGAVEQEPGQTPAQVEEDKR